MQYVILCVILVILFGLGKTLVVAGERTNAGMRLHRRCERRYEGLVREGLGKREALMRISAEEYPQLSRQVHERIVDKCHDVRRLVNFFSVVLDGPRPMTWAHVDRLTDREAKALLEATTVAESGRVSTDFRAAAVLKDSTDSRS
jgi:hypothetical protein